MCYAAQKAQALVKRYGTRSPWELAECLDYAVIEHPFPSRIKGIITKFFSRVIIGINQTLEQPLKKVVLAHEIGHAQLHSGFGHYFVLENTLFPTGKMEREATIFAAELFLGDTGILPGKSNEQIAREAMVPVELVDIWLGFKQKPQLGLVAEATVKYKLK